MAETVDELVAKHSRRELEKMAYELGVEDVTDLSKYPHKDSIAEALLNARKEREGVVEKVRAAFKPEVGKAELRIGKKGVFAKRVAMEQKAAKIQASIAAQAKENEEAVAKIGTGVEAQAKENKEAVAKIGTGIEAQAKENKEAVAKIGTGVEAQAKENESYVKDFYYG